MILRAIARTLRVVARLLAEVSSQLSSARSFPGARRAVACVLGDEGRTA